MNVYVKACEAMNSRDANITTESRRANIKKSLEFLLNAKSFEKIWYSFEADESIYKDSVVEFLEIMYNKSLLIYQLEYLLICVNNANSNNSNNDNYISLHKFLANYKPKVKTDEQMALNDVNKPVSIYVKNDK